ncbi:MAG: RNA polymerase subunit sigma-70 [Marinilabiliales bacterium]|nr:MAG: RNA polymerase subunit sigma-70 [Marinilabiliales bacterium]
MTETDEAIIERVLSGRREDFALLVDKYKDKVFALVIGIIKNNELAKEVAQDAFVKTFVSLKKFRKESSFSTWIYRIAYNTAISETRKASYKNVALDERYLVNNTEINDESEIKEEEHRKLNKAISLLKSDEKLILEMYYYEEKAVKEISEITGLGKSNVKIKLHRLRKKLRNLIEEHSGKEILLY